MTYIPIEVAEHFDDFIIERDEQILNTVKARTKDFSTLTLLKLLYQVKPKEMSFSELYSKSNIRIKKSFLNYLHLCMNYNFIEKQAVGPNMIYSITEKGETMLELFMQKKSN